MVSLWPWHGDDASPASFERALSNLSTKISKNTTHLDTLRQRSRRLKALWTLYTSFAYILYTLILALVVGWRHWTPVEYTAIAGGPVVIFLIRQAFTTYYNYRIASVTSRLEELQKERDTTIEKLKAATKYNSTQQLLEKYGGSSSSTSSPAGASKRKSGPSVQDSPRTPRGQGQRTGMPPPPTANIPRNDIPSAPSTPQPPPVNVAQRPINRQVLPPSYPSSPTQAQQADDPLRPGPAEFAPNAFPSSAQYSSQSAGSAHWYDRVMDLLLGEDETLPKNRVALICQHCRLVNGQAPPGIKGLEDVGKWRCGGCGGWNGEESVGKKLVAEIKQQVGAGTEDRPAHGAERVSSEDDAVMVSGADDGEEPEAEEPADDEDEVEHSTTAAEEPVKPKRGRPKGSGKKKA
ncbi:MAG: hypothetical protein M1817_002810 [Caeruleum heppii]|nr:MAG: hypothetical protein M1817_002810 [Caeruleum heppii]